MNQHRSARTSEGLILIAVGVILLALCPPLFFHDGTWVFTISGSVTAVFGLVALAAGVFLHLRG